MKRIGVNSIFIKVLTLSIITTLFPTTAVQAAGRASTTKTTNTILSGPSVPGVSIGKNGDFYIDTKSMNFYGPKKNNLWPIPVSLRGPVGPSGASGVDGRNGSTANATAGVAGATGGQGLAGAQGSIGATGPAGAQGSIGATGPAGAQGTTGATGPAGATGAAGVSSTSAITKGGISFASLINGVPGSSTNSTGFGNFIANKRYVVDVLIYATNLDSLAYPLKVAFESSLGSPVITTNYLVMNGSSYRTSTLRPEYSILAKVLVDASSVEAAFGLIATVTCGSQTGGNSQKLTVAGDFTAYEVGSIS